MHQSILPPSASPPTASPASKVFPEGQDPFSSAGSGAGQSVYLSMHCATSASVTLT